MKVEELINKLKEFPPDTQVLVPSDDGSKFGFDLTVTTVYEVERVAEGIAFSYNKVGVPLLLLEIKSD